MALPPNMVAPGLNLDDTAGLPEIEVSVDEPMQFPNGAEVIDDGEGGAIVQALLAGRGPRVPSRVGRCLCQWAGSSWY
jgi:hypothetical protein